MKRLQRTPATTRSSQEPQPENLDTPVDLKGRVFTMLRDDNYWHDRIKRILTAAGFVTRRIEQMETRIAARRPRNGKNAS